MSDYLLSLLNFVANLTMIPVGVVIVFVLFQMRRIVFLLQSVLAPKTGIEGYLNMCAQVVDCDPDGTCVVADDGEIVLVNKKMEDISGYHRSELIGQLVEILVPSAARGMHKSHREGFVDSPSLRPMRGLVLQHKRGREVPVEIWLNNYKDSSGGFTIAKVRVPDNEWSSN